MRSIEYAGNRIEVRFEYTPGLVASVKDLPDRKWDAQNRCWYLSTSKFHAEEVVRWGKDHKFPIDTNVLMLAREDTSQRIIGVGDSKVRSGLFPFQSEGVDFLHKANGRAILADDTGLGKTIQTLYYMKEIQPKRILVLCPASVVGKWKIETNTWVPELSIQTLRKGKDTIENVNMLIMTYQMLVNVYSRLKSRHFDLLVVDECHHLSNGKTQIARITKIMNYDKMIALSATPFLNRPIELFNILNTLRSDLYPSWYSFATRYCGLERGSFGLEVKGATNLDELARRLSDILLRRTKEVLGDALPPIMRSKLPIDITVAHYRFILKSYAKKTMTPSDYHQMFGELRHVLGRAKVEPAVELALDILQDSSKKVVLFCFHLDVAEMIADKLELSILRPDILSGKESQQDRDSMKSGFQEDDLHQAIVITTAGGEGIDLFRASDVIFVERMWNPGKEEQIEGRLHRIGQRSSVTAHYIIILNTIDERIENLINRKRAVNSGIIESSDVEIVTLDIMKDWFREEVGNLA
jgi:SWI/SNF-related matrix-associated actin-dependent regulator 1 of chromatin subfamily A